MAQQSQNKTQLAKKLGVSRASLYYQPKQDSIDEDIKQKIQDVLSEHKSYGHKRIALELKLNKKRILRVMKKYGIKPYRRRAAKPRKSDDEGKKQVKWQNEVIGFCPIKPNVIWASDFTYIKFQGVFLYLATLIDVYTREIVGWHVSTVHDTNLVLGALKHAIERTGTVPIYLHSDQGSEYDAKAYEEFVICTGIVISMSHKNSPWENAFQESFYSQFKVDLGYASQFETIEELVEGIYRTIHYYNTRRIHTSLKMAPVVFKQQFEERLVRIPV